MHELYKVNYFNAPVTTDNILVNITQIEFIVHDVISGVHTRRILGSGLSHDSSY